MPGLKTVKSQEYDWRAEDDMRILIEAEKIKGDAKRLKAAQACAKKKMMDVAKVAADTDD